MANITRFDPFSTNLNDLFEGLFLRPVRIDANGGQQLQMRKKDERVFRSERYYGRLERSFTLDHDVDEAAVDEVQRPRAQSDATEKN